MQEYDSDLDELVESHRAHRARKAVGQTDDRADAIIRRGRIRRMLVATLVVLAVLFGAAGAYFYRNIPQALAGCLPAQAGGFPVTNVMSGEDAMKSTVGLHKGKLGRPKEAVIGAYGPGTSVWLMSYANAARARESVVKMANKMPKYGKDFQKVTIQRRKGLKLYVTKPGGFNQYYWAQGRVVAYLVPGEMLKPEAFNTIDEISRALYYYQLLH